jgi:DNA (cytosine-5)-methyltransferase 1
MSGLIVDSFAGGGGASLGIERALGRPVDLAINHDADAIAMHAANHPHAVHLAEDVWKVDPLDATGGAEVDLLWASPDCKHFSRAKGSKPVEKRIRGLAWVVVKWARDVRPAVICLENVREFQEWGPLTADQRPCVKRKGLTFRRFVGNLRALGYVVDFRVLDAADFGAATHRRRLFLIARCDGLPIVWPAPTHGPWRAHPWRGAHEIIDWSIPCPSIFGRSRPLADATLRRIANGIRRYVFDCPKPFIVSGYGEREGQAPRFIPVEDPLPAVVATAKHSVCTPYLAPLTHHGDDRTNGPHDPLPTITCAHRGEFALIAPHLQQFFGGMVGKDLREPVPTVTATDHNALAAAFLTKFYGTSTGSSMFAPTPTSTAQGGHLGQVRAFLVKYFGTSTGGQSLYDSLHTITAKDRFGLVPVNGEPYQLVDIGLRMLTPRELARAQGFPDSYELTGTKTSQVARIGNSVCPVMAEVIVRANCAQPEVAEAIA